MIDSWGMWESPIDPCCFINVFVFHWSLGNRGFRMHYTRNETLVHYNNLEKLSNLSFFNENAGKG